MLVWGTASTLRWAGDRLEPTAETKFNSKKATVTAIPVPNFDAVERLLELGWTAVAKKFGKDWVINCQGLHREFNIFAGTEREAWAQAIKQAEHRQ
jgi:hypothetical protein